MTQWYKVLDSEGRPQSGGDKEFRYSLPTAEGPGEWTREVDPHTCRRGYHLTAAPRVWINSAADRLFEAEGERPADGGSEDKTAFARVRLLREVSDTADWHKAREDHARAEVDRAYALKLSARNYRIKGRADRMAGRAFPHTRHEAESALAKARGGRRKLARNTWLERDSSGDPAVRFHDTNVVTFLPDGGFRLDSGRWRTVTTMQRIRACGIGLDCARGVWGVGKALFRDGMTLDRRGRANSRECGSFKAAVREYVRERARARRAWRKQVAESLKQAAGS